MSRSGRTGENAGFSAESADSTNTTVAQGVAEPAVGADPIDALARRIASLSADERARLAGAVERVEARTDSEGAAR